MPAAFARAGSVRVRESLLDAAAMEFWESGLAGTRIQDILDRAAVSRTSLYHHFAGKTEMADAIVAERTWQRMTTDDAAGTGRGLPALGRFLRAAAEHAERDVRARALVRIAHELPDPAADSGLEAWRNRVRDTLEQAVVVGDIPGAVATASVAAGVASLLRAAILEPAAGDDFAERARVLWLLMRPGLGAAGHDVMSI
ncbi:TetR family transcriptional regulator [uncultured Microbacterium sp.]|uniref:TetR family transcriptional regulator n=1 Tax=uncultured Microbacterium sp. TaxID=191216 RepID=UPI0035C95043